jgi:predicted flap endonuclease-1-like 5' DNA nuclease
LSETRRLLLEFKTEEVGKLARENNKIKEELVKAFSDPSEVVRQRALLAAIDFGDPEIVPKVEEIVSADDDAEVRIAAAQALAWYQQPRSIPTLLEALKDQNTWVKSHSAAGLSKLVNGPIWARVDEETVDKILNGFPDMTDEEIRDLLLRIEVRPNQIDKFMRWREENFEVEIDESIIQEKLEGRPILIKEPAPIEVSEDKDDTLPAGIGPEVKKILLELPPHMRESLPEEDLVRLNPKSARELVDSLISTFPEGEKPKEKKKAVKVRRVKRVRRKKKGPTRQDLINQIPDQVKNSLPEGTLEGLSIEELEALVSAESEAEIPEGAKEEKSYETVETGSGNLQMISGVGPALEANLIEAGFETIEKIAAADPGMLEKKVDGLGAKGSVDLVAKAKENLGIADTKDETLDSDLVEKYGKEKAAILSLMPAAMLSDIPEEQIKEMDVDTLKDLADALEPKD